jgi:hypothetical protein
MTIAPALRFTLHLAIAVALVALVHLAVQHRRTAVAERSREAALEQAETARTRDAMERDRALRDGLRANDPFAVELIARDRLGWSRPGEQRPPPAPGAVDNPGGTGNR